MQRKIYRTASVREYDKIKLKRRLEVAGLLLSAVLLVWIIIGQITVNDEATYSSVLSCSANSPQYMVNTTEAILFDNGSALAPDGMMYPVHAYWKSEEITWLCPCMISNCVHKCCPPGETYSDELVIDYYGETQSIFNCTKNNVTLDLISRMHPTALSHNTSGFIDNFYVISGSQNCPERFLLPEIENMNTHLLSDGSLTSRSFDKLSYDMFCAETMTNSSEVKFELCFYENEEVVNESEYSWIYQVQGVLMLAASVPSLVLTLITYAVLPPLRNLHGKAFLCHVTCLTVAYTCLGFTNIQTILNTQICVPIGFIIYFAILGNFFWLNVISFDIWWVFSGLMALRTTRKLSENVKFLLYSLYGWGGPSLLLAFALIMQYHPTVPHFIVKPEIGLNNCFLSTRESRMFYVYLPIGILVYLNCALFFLTSLRFQSHSKSVKKLERSGSRRHCGVTETCPEVDRFSLYFKLSMVMGVPWLLEILSFCVGISFLLHILDVVNSLQGVFLLYLFICNRRTLYLLGQKLCPCFPPFSKGTPNQTIGYSTRMSTVRHPRTTSVTATSPTQNI